MTLSPRDYNISGLPARFMHPGELEVLLCLMESVNPKVVVEFGVHTGRNAVAALRNIKTIERYVGVDVEQGYVTRMSAQRKEIPAVPGELALGMPGFELIVRRRGSFELSADDLPKADAVFIDGDHSRVGVLNDTKLARAIIQPGGIVIWHDDNGLKSVEVTQTLNDLCADGAKIEHVQDTWIAYERY